MIDTAELFGCLTRSVQFTVTEEHLKLLRRLLIRWEECEGYGAPAINSKRPYGNSAVPEDVAEILGLPDGEWEWEEEEVVPGFDDEPRSYRYLSDETEDRMLRAHVEAGMALKVVLAAGEFRAACYRREGDYGWRRVAD